jgi:uncharacterized protein (DUF3084 family)
LGSANPRQYPSFSLSASPYKSTEASSTTTTTTTTTTTPPTATRMTASRDTGLQGSFGLNAPDESLKIDDEYKRLMKKSQRLIEALEDSIRRDALRFRFSSKEFEETCMEVQLVQAEIDRIQETKKVREGLVAQQSAQISEKENKLEALRQSLARLREAKVTSVFPDTHGMVLTTSNRHENARKTNRSIALKR